MGVLETFDDCPGDILLVSWRYFIVVPEIFYLCSGDTFFVSWIYIIGVLEIFLGVLEIFCWLPGDILLVS